MANAVSNNGSASNGTEFGLHQSARYIPDLVLRVFPGRKGYPDLPNVEEMDAHCTLIS